MSAGSRRRLVLAVEPLEDRLLLAAALAGHENKRYAPLKVFISAPQA